MATTFLATQCPAIQSKGTALWLSDTGVAPPTSQQLTTSALGATGTSDKLNKNAKSNDLGHRYGAGSYGIGYGLGLSAGAGLSVVVADGHAIIDGLVEVRSHADLVVNASGNNWIWLKSDGTIVVQTLDSIAKPTGNVCLLGCAVCDGSGVTSIDTSGVGYYIGGILYRSTADVGMPGDTPASDVSFISRSLGGDYLWDGTQYVKLQVPGVGTQAMADANQTAAASVYKHRRIRTTGAITANRDLVLPLIDEEWMIVNDCSGAFSIVVKGASGASVTIANGKTAIVRCDGTDFKRVTADTTH